MYKMVFFVPEAHCEQVKSALFEVGVGKIGDYDCCSWQVMGQGQFRALAGSRPFIGEEGKVEVVAEYRVEMVCSDQLINKAVETLKLNHPYEEPAYDVWRVESDL